jgi:Leucine-rich repeat (LRR) protein
MLTRRDIFHLSSLPQLQHLHVSHCNDSDLTSLAALSSLQSFSCEVWDYKQDGLLGLSQVPMQNLALRYWNVPTTAAANAAAWSKLPQLQELQLLAHDYHPSKQQMSSILAGLAACSSLTKLSIDGSYSLLLDYVDNPDGLFLNPAQLELVQQLAGAAAAATGTLSVCGSLASLTTLRDLTLTYVFEVPGHHRSDALALTSLTGLTRLVLANSRAAVDDHAATALAANLRQLDLSGCDLGDMACLAAIGQTLTQLTGLQLRGSGDVTRAGLMQLTKLQRLQWDRGRQECRGVDSKPDLPDVCLSRSLEVSLSTRSAAVSRCRWYIQE